MNHFKETEPREGLPRWKKSRPIPGRNIFPTPMGMIQPEWLFMSHFFEDPEEEEEQEPPPPAVKPRNIRINIRPRRR
jgi:hypothetical protein